MSYENMKYQNWENKVKYVLRKNFMALKVCIKMYVLEKTKLKINALSTKRL